MKQRHHVYTTPRTYVDLMTLAAKVGAVNQRGQHTLSPLMEIIARPDVARAIEKAVHGRENGMSENTAEQLASDRGLWEEYIDPANNQPFDTLTYEERVAVIVEIWPDTPRE